MEAGEKKRGNAKGSTSEVVARQVRARRQSLGLDLAGLSAELTNLDWPIPVAALSRLENGQRRIDVDDLMALAVALKTTPNELLLAPGNPEVFATGTGLPEWVRSDEAMMWAIGNIPLDKDHMRRWWASRLPNLNEQLRIAANQLEAARSEAPGHISKLVADFEVEEAQELVNHWTLEVNKVALREAQLRAEGNG